MTNENITLLTKATLKDKPNTKFLFYRGYFVFFYFSNDIHMKGLIHRHELISQEIINFDTVD